MRTPAVMLKRLSHALSFSQDGVSDRIEKAGKTPAWAASLVHRYGLRTPGKCWMGMFSEGRYEQSNVVSPVRSRTEKKGYQVVLVISPDQSSACLIMATCLSAHCRWPDLRCGQDILTICLPPVKQPKQVDSDLHCCQKQTKYLPGQQTNLIVREIFGGA